MQIISDINRMQKLANQWRRDGKTIGFVPTMGYLHEGHLSLFRIARPKCDILVISIFVNPTQFGENEDLDKYPRDFERDKKLCEKEEVDVIFYPVANEVYAEPYLTYVNVDKITKTMCGISRPTHFRGVSTIVCKLFNIVKPHFAVFGQKDYQQLLVIKQMVKDLNFDIEILEGPIVRENDGLAMSSRNRYLNPQERKDATILYKSLQLARELIESGIRNPAVVQMKMEQAIQKVPSASVDYIAIVDGKTLEPVNEIKDYTLIALAVFIGNARLIDNMLIRLPNQ